MLFGILTKLKVMNSVSWDRFCEIAKDGSFLGNEYRAAEWLYFMFRIEDEARLEWNDDILFWSAVGHFA